MTDQAKPKLTEAERLEKMRAGRAKAGAAVRSMRADVLENQEDFINSPEFRAKHKTNSIVKRAYADLWANREKYKVNPDGSAMTIEDEIAHRNARGEALSDRQRKHLGLPTKKEEKEAEAKLATMTREELAFRATLTPDKQAVFDALQPEERLEWIDDPEADLDAA